MLERNFHIVQSIPTLDVGCDIEADIRFGKNWILENPSKPKEDNEPSSWDVDFKRMQRHAPTKAWIPTVELNMLSNYMIDWKCYILGIYGSD